MNRRDLSVVKTPSHWNGVPTWDFAVFDRYTGRKLWGGAGFVRRDSAYGAEAHDAIEIATRALCDEPRIVWPARKDR